MLITQNVNLDQVQIRGEELIRNIAKVEQQLKQTYISNPLSSECDSLFYIFYRYISINQRRERNFRRDGKLANEFALMNEKEIFNKVCIPSSTKSRIHSLFIYRCYTLKER
jgi:hypothetical protein